MDNERERRDAALEAMWDELEDVPFDWNENNDLYLSEDWYIFKAGTPREELWRWFDEKHSQGIGYLLHERTRNRLQEHIKKLEKL